MLSRVADSIYWIARYLERAENVARLVNVNAHLLLDMPRKATLGWQPLIDITGDATLFDSLYNEASERNVVRFLIADGRNPGSILNTVKSARENARTIRDIIPREAWEGINALFLEVKANLPAGLAHRRRFDFLRSIIDTNQGITGLLAGTMLHDYGYDVLRMGRNLERADMTTRIVDVRSTTLLPHESEELTPFENIQWMSVLHSLSALQSYTQKVQGPVRRAAVIRFLLQEREFPRAFLHCVGEVRTCLQALPHNDDPMRYANRILRNLRSAKPDQMPAKKLQKFLDRSQLSLARLDAVIRSTYFALDRKAPIVEN